MDRKLKQKLDNVKMLMKNDWDVVIQIDGMEGVGKSTLSFIVAWYVSDGKITLDNVCEGTQDAKNKLDKLPDKSTLIVDEGSLMFSSKEVMRTEQRQLIKILQVIRQKCMCLIIVSPSFFELNKYVAVSRSRFLLHCYTDKKLGRGKYAYFGQRRKALLYQLGKKNFGSYAKPRSEFLGRFTKFNPFGDAYLEMKKRSLSEAFNETKKYSKEYINGVRDGKIEFTRLIIPYFPISSQRDLAKALNLTDRTITKWANPKEIEVEVGN